MSTISTSGISPSQIIRSTHLLRIINALDGTTNDDIIISGSLNALHVTGSFTGSFKGDGSQLTNIIGEWDGTLDGAASITGSLVVSGTLRVGSTIVTGSTIYGTTPNAIIGEYNGGVLDIRNTNTSVNAGDTLGVIQFTAKDDASTAYTSAKIEVTAQNAPNMGDGGGGNLKFYTSTGGTSVSPSERMIISSSGNVYISSSLIVANGITGSIASSSFALTSSYLLGSAESASYALTASYILGGGGTSIDTGSFATTGSNIFIGNQTITGSALISGSIILSGSNAGIGETTTIRYNNIEIDNPTSGYDYNAKLYSDNLVFDDSGFIQTSYGNFNISRVIGSNAQYINLPVSLTGGAKTITFPNDTGTVALTYNTATTGSNTFTGNQTITGSVSITSVLTLVPNDPLPTSQPTGSISVSGSGVDCKPYFYNGITWTSLI